MCIKSPARILGSEPSSNCTRSSYCGPISKIAWIGATKDCIETTLGLNMTEPS